MKKQKNATRIIAIVLVLLMALALIPFAASADNVTWTFNGNGGTYLDSEEHAQSVYTQSFESGVASTLQIPTFTREHFTLKGWKRTNPDVDGGALWQNGSNVTTSTSSQLEAQWEQILVSVSFDGGAHGTGSMASDENLDAGSTYTVPTAWSGTSDTGWEFAGWKQGSAPVGATIELPDTDVTLTAQWQMVDPVTIHFDGNGNTGGSVPDDITTPRTVPVQVPASPVPTRTGYRFLGYAESATATAADYTAGDEIPNPDSGSTKTVYAAWAKDEVTIKFLPGDAAATGSMNDVKKLRGYEYYLPSKDFCGFKVTGKDFYAWQVENGSVQAPGSELIWPAGDYTTLNVTALWKTVFKVICFHNDGSGKNDVIQVVDGNSVDKLDSLPNTTIGGKQMKFIGWYANPSANPETDAPYAVPFTPDQDVDLYAGWLSATIPVEFDKNGGKTEMADDAAPRGGKYTLPECSILPPTAKAFKQWLIGETAYDPGDEIDVPLTGVEKISVKAEWQDDVMQGTVTVTAAEGTVVGKTIFATAEITNPDPAGTVRYQWARSEDGMSNWEAIGQPSTSNKYTIQASDLGTYLRCTVTCSNKTGSSLLSNVVGPVTGDTVILTVTQQDYGDVPGEVTIQYADGTPITTVTAASDSGPVLKNTPLTLTVTPPDGKVVKTVGGKSAAASYSFTLTANMEVAVVYTNAGSHGEKNITVYPSKEPTSESTDPVSAAGKAEAINAIAAEDPSRGEGAAYDMIICYNNNPSDRVTDPTLLKKQSFVLRFPASVKKGNYGKGSFDEAWTYGVFHYDSSTGLTQLSDGVTYTTSGSILKATVTGQEDFSPYITAAAPKELIGKVNLSVSGTRISDTADVSPGQTLYFQDVSGTNAVNTSFHYSWYYDTGVKIDGAADDKDYVVKFTDIGKNIVCRVTHDVQTGYIESGAHTVSGNPNPKVEYIKGWIINDGETQRGTISDVSSEMEYRAPGSSTWTPITGTSVKDLLKSGVYWVRFKDDTNSKNWASVEVPDYYTVTCVAENYSSRVDFKATGTGVVQYSPNIWLVPKPTTTSGSAITVTAASNYTKYFKITNIRSVPNVGANKSGRANSLSLTLTKQDILGNGYFTVYARVGVDGAKTGDTSHLELWVELAALSLMGLGAALVIARKKLKAQK